MTNIEYYKTKEIAEIGFMDYPDWGCSFDEWLNVEHKFEMPALYGRKSVYPYYTITYEKAKKLTETTATN